MLKSAVLAIMVYFSVAFAAEGQQPTTPAEMNKYLSTITYQVLEAHIAFALRVQEADATKKYDTLRATGNTYRKWLDVKLVELSAIKDVGGSKKLRKGIIEYLNNQKKFIDTDWLPLEQINKNTTQDEIDRMLTELGEKAKVMDEELKKLSDVQAAYIKKNHITGEKPAPAGK